ncbi:hypothetical protein WH47_12126 [Habropoda laboriosa]|uniref:Histone-lysine N-methyltransferase SETMAR n=1 Tax=Habropoda laboriosa TaxID=597456 RepID=A0A0L7RAL1_9HYME|nr:hypothetical protein WH47_12126 [Habropoda laboriosa]
MKKYRNLFFVLVPIDFHIFRLLQSSFDGKILNNFQAVKSAISFFTDKSEDFSQLPYRWETVC